MGLLNGIIVQRTLCRGNLFREDHSSAIWIQRHLICVLPGDMPSLVKLLEILAKDAIVRSFDIVMPALLTLPKARQHRNLVNTATNPLPHRFEHL